MLNNAEGGGWWLVAVGGWRLVAGAWWSLGAVLKGCTSQKKNKEKLGFLRTALLRGLADIGGTQLFCSHRRGPRALFILFQPLAPPLEIG